MDELLRSPKIKMQISMPSRTSFIASLLSILLALQACAEIRELKVLVEHGRDGVTTASIKSDVAAENRAKTSISDAAEVLKAAAGWRSTVYVTVDTNDVVLSDYLPLLSAIATNNWLTLRYVGQIPKPQADPPEMQPYIESLVERKANDPLSEDALIEKARTDARARHFLADLWDRKLLSAKARERIVSQHVQFSLVEQFPHDPKRFPDLRELKILALTDFPFPESAWVDYSGTISVGEQKLDLPVDAFGNSRSLHRSNTQYFASLGGSFAGDPVARGAIQMREVARGGERTETLWSIKVVTNELKLERR